MSWPLFIIERGEDKLFTLPGGEKVETHDLPPGAMFKCFCHEGEGWLISLPHQNPDRKWGRLWCTLQQAGDGQQWQVSGEAPNLTVNPSINCTEPGGWHGHIQNGVITDGSYN